MSKLHMDGSMAVVSGEMRGMEFISDVPCRSGCTVKVSVMASAVWFDGK